MKKIYLDNAASTPMDAEVLDFMIAKLRESTGNPSSVHHHGRGLRNEIEKARKIIASELGCSPAEIFFTSGGTEADNMAIRGAIAAGCNHIITTAIEHHAVTSTVERLEADGKASVTWLPVDEKGNPDLIALEAALQQHPKSLVTLMHANNELGTMIDLVQIGELCEKYGAVFHSDTVQAMGNVTYNLSQMPLHMLSASAHKFYGPKGIGFIYVSALHKIPPMILGGSQERNMRAGTENVPAIAAMAFALQKCYQTLETKNAHLRDLKYYFKAQLEQHIPGVKFNGEIDPEKSIPTVLNVCFPAVSEEAMLLFNLDIAGISVSGGSACTSGSVHGSHVLHGIGLSEVDSANSIRFSFGIQNTKEELDICIAHIRECLAILA